MKRVSFITITAILCTATLLFGTTNIYAQSANADSLKYIITYFHEHTTDVKLRQLIKEAEALYNANTINDSLAQKLLVLEELLYNTPDLDQKKFLSFAESVARHLENLPPEKQHPAYASSLVNLADLYKDLAQYKRALPLYELGLALRKKTLGENHPDYDLTLCTLALLFERLGEYNKALPLFQDLVELRKQNLGEDSLEYAQSLSTLARLHLRMGDYKKPLPMLLKALAITKKAAGEENRDYVNSLINLAVLYERMGRSDKALSLCLQAVKLSNKVWGEATFEHSISLITLANFYSSRNEYEQALPLFQKVLGIRKKIFGEQHAQYAACLFNIAKLYNSIGQYEKAISVINQALDIRKKAIGEDHEYSLMLENLAISYVRLNDFKKALPLLEQALAIRKKVLGERHPDYANTLSSLARMYTLMGEYDKALPLFQHVLMMRKKDLKKVSPEYVISLDDIAGLYYKMHQYKKSLSLYKRALKFKTKILGEYHSNNVISLNGLGLASSVSGDYANAIASLIKANTIKLNHLNQTYFSLSEQEKMALLNTEFSQFNYLPSLLFATSKAQPALIKQVFTNELALKGMVLEDQQHVLRSIQKTGDSTALQLYEQWLTNKALSGKQQLLPVNERMPELDSMEEATNELEQQLSRRAAAFGNLQRSHAVTVSDIHKKLVKGEAVVEFIQFKLYDKRWTDSTMYAALILLPEDSNAKFIPLFEERQLQRLLRLSGTEASASAAIQQLYRGVVVGNNAGPNHDSLYQLIWKPLEVHLKGISTIYYAPSGLLHRVAFQALRPDSTKYLLEKYKLNQLLSTRSVALPQQVVSKPVSASIWGDIQYNYYRKDKELPALPSDEPEEIDTNFSAISFYTFNTRGSGGEEWRPLPGTKQEIDSLLNLFKPANIRISVDSGSMATEEAFKALSGKSPQVLHLATHGFFLPVGKSEQTNGLDQTLSDNAFMGQQNPMFRSGLVLAGGNQAWKGEAGNKNREDGILTAYEIAQLDLSNTDLVVLSACETALGELQGNEGVLGLQRAFKLAGVKHMIMSLWRVPDKETMELMTMFYRNWLGGKSTAESLRLAQLKMKEKYPPYYWAAFTLVQ